MRMLRTEADISEALAELLALEPRFGPTATKAGAIPLRFRWPDCAALSAIIVSQMVSRASADAIWARLLALAGEVTPDSLLGLDEAQLRSVGLSGGKIRALKALAEACAGGLDLAAVGELPADEALVTLTAIKGVGPWSAEVFLLFSAGHPDVFPAGDVALQSAAGWALGLETAPKAVELRRLAEAWRPFRSVAARLLWAFYAVERRGAGLVAG